MLVLIAQVARYEVHSTTRPTLYSIEVDRMAFHPAQVVITGSSRGLGYALADQFLAFGDDVVVSSRTEQACKEAAEKLAERYPSSRVLHFACDVRNAGRWSA